MSPFLSMQMLGIVSYAGRFDPATGIWTATVITSDRITGVGCGADPELAMRGCIRDIREQVARAMGGAVPRWLRRGDEHVVLLLSEMRLRGEGASADVQAGRHR